MAGLQPAAASYLIALTSQQDEAPVTKLLKGNFTAPNEDSGAINACIPVAAVIWKQIALFI